MNEYWHCLTGPAHSQPYLNYSAVYHTSIGAGSCPLVVLYCHLVRLEKCFYGDVSATASAFTSISGLDCWLEAGEDRISSVVHKASSGLIPRYPCPFLSQNPAIQLQALLYNTVYLSACRTINLNLITPKVYPTKSPVCSAPYRYPSGR